MSDSPKSTFARRVRAAKPRDKRFEVRDDAVPVQPVPEHQAIQDEATRNPVAKGVLLAAFSGTLRPPTGTGARAPVVSRTGQLRGACHA